jgi:2-oxo-3-hexenedioate decarboxylase
MDDRAAVEDILEALGTGRQIPCLTARSPGFKLADAYRVARRIRDEREKRGEKPVGRKIGFTNRASWAKFRASAQMWGYIYASTVHDLAPDGSRASLAGLPEPRIEPEIVFGLASAPAPDMDERALADCIGWVAHGFEIVESVYPDWDCFAPDAVAAFGMHASCWIGPRHAFAPRASDWISELAACEVDLYRDGEHADHGVAANVLDGPLNALRELVALLAADPHNPPLAAGEIVTTGSLTRALPIAALETWTTKLAGAALEGICLEFTP